MKWKKQQLGHRPKENDRQKAPVTYPRDIFSINFFLQPVTSQNFHKRGLVYHNYDFARATYPSYDLFPSNESAP